MYSLDKVRTFVINDLNAYNVITSDDVRNNFIALYHYAFGDALTCEGCENEITRAIIRFKAFLKMHTNETELQKSTTLMKYEMKPSTRVYSNKLKMMVTRANCTDAIAKVLIEEKESNINLFEVNESYKEEVKARKPRTRKPKQVQPV